MEWILGVALFGAGVLVTLLVKSFLPSYAATKGKNLATKEDVAAITEQVKAVEARFNKAGHAYEVQFEHELKAFTEIWELVVDVMAAGENLRPAIDQMPASEEERRQRDRERFERFSEATENLALAMYKRRPFYPEEVFEKLVALRTAARQEVLDFQERGVPGTADDWRVAQKNREDILEKGDAVGEAIRARLKALRMVD